ncbi:hypothetical protein JXM67_13005 [candidate division WOR-3 bacterium]|nr:hypothetical protein [candidate division WOR-3 bacterium]
MKRLVGLLGIALACTVLSAKGSHLLNGGIVHYRDQRFERADSLFLESIKQKLAVTEATFWHGKASVRLENYVEGGRAFLKVLETGPAGEEMIKLDPEGSQLAQITLYNGANELIKNRGNPDTVVIFLRTALELKPGVERNLILLGYFFLEEGLIDSALSVAAEIEANDSLSPDAPYMKGRTFHTEALSLDSTELREAKYTQAMDNYNLAVERYNDQLTQLQVNVAKPLKLDANQIPILLTALDSLQQRDPEPTLEDKLALLSERVNLDEPKAMQFLDWLKGYNGKKTQIANVYYYIGRIYLEQKKDSLADVIFTEANKLNPGNLNVLWDGSVAKYRLKKYDEAIMGFRKYDEKTPGEADYFSTIYLGLCYLGKDPPDFEEAHNLFTRAKEMDPENPEPYYYLAGLYEERANFDQANKDKWVKEHQKWYAFYKEKDQAQKEGGSR